jgi:hypothetical protein
MCVCCDHPDHQRHRGRQCHDIGHGDLSNPWRRGRRDPDRDGAPFRVVKPFGLSDSHAHTDPDANPDPDAVFEFIREPYNHAHPGTYLRGFLLHADEH